MPAMPMNDAAERYSPEIAEAFQPTETDRPATKKSLAVLEVVAERKPIQIVTATVMRENVRIHGSTAPICARMGRERVVISVSPFRAEPVSLHLPRAPWIA